MLLQKMYFSASCITRFPLLPVTSPKEPLVGLELAPPAGNFSSLDSGMENEYYFEVSGHANHPTPNIVGGLDNRYRQPMGTKTVSTPYG